MFLLSNQTWRCICPQRTRPQTRRATSWDSCPKSSFISRPTRLDPQTPKTRSSTPLIKGPKTTCFCVPQALTKWRNSQISTYTSASTPHSWTSALPWRSNSSRAVKPKTKSSSASISSVERIPTRRPRIILIRRSRITEQCSTWWKNRGNLWCATKKWFRKKASGSSIQTLSATRKNSSWRDPESSWPKRTRLFWTWTTSKENFSWCKNGISCEVSRTNNLPKRGRSRGILFTRRGTSKGSKPNSS